MHLKAGSNDIVLAEADADGCGPDDRALADTVGLLRSIIETAPGLIYAKDRHGRMLVANSAALDLIGKPWAGVAGRTDAEFLPDPGQSDAVMANDRAVMEGGCTQEIEEWVTRPGQPPSLFLSKKTPMRDGTGAVVGLIGVSVDITERKAAEAELRRLNADLEASVRARTAERDRAWRNSQDLLLVVDSDGIIRAANPAWMDVLGRRPEEVVGRHHLSFNTPEDRPVAEAAHAVASVGPLQTIHTRVLHKDGTTRWVAWVASMEGGLIYASGRDVTGQVAAAEALADAGERLRQSQKMEAVGQLTGGIAHDFNNMLQGMSGAVQLMKRRLWAGEIGTLDRYLDIMQHSVDRAASLTNGLLAFSRKQSLAPTRVELADLVSVVVVLLRQTMGPNVEVRTQLQAECWPIQCDRNQLENALLNLAINARDAMQPGGGTLLLATEHATLGAGDISTMDGAQPGDFVRVSVTDTGCGMTPEVLGHACEPFFTTKAVGQGTGLGLSQVFGFVNQSNGLVRLQSEPGRGTSVQLYLPRHPEPAAETDRSGASGAAAQPGRITLAGATVLLVEDEADNRGMAADMLREMGCTVVEAPDGDAGLAILRDGASQVDLLVADVGLPGGIDGRQLACAGRAMAPDLRVVLITGFAGASLDNGATIPPGIDLLRKPFRLEALAGCVQAALSR